MCRLNISETNHHLMFATLYQILIQHLSVHGAFCNDMFEDLRIFSM